MIVAIGLVGAISVLTSSALINVMKTNKEIAMHQSVMEDAQTIINMLVAEIKNNAIDYEEYFNRNCGYNIGFGVQCPQGYSQYSENFPGGKPNNNEDAIKTGTNIYQSYLFLRSPDGMKKIIYGLKKTDKSRNTEQSKPEQILAVLNLKGCDNDENGIPEKFIIDDDGYNCSDPPEEANPPSDAELTTPGDVYKMKKFHPASLTRTDIIDIKFYITPSNDPHKAYNDPNSVYQPKVVIVLTVKPSASVYGNAVNNMAPFTIQTTVSQEYLGEIKS